MAHTKFLINVKMGESSLYVHKSGEGFTLKKLRSKATRFTESEADSVAESYSDCEAFDEVNIESLMPYRGELEFAE